MTASNDVTGYGQRAAAAPMPLDWVEPALPLMHGAELAADLAAAGQTFWADSSIYQPVITAAYPYPKFGFRGDSGTATDGHAGLNWAYCEDPDRMPVAVTYVVFKPGQSAAIMRRLRNLFGTHPARHLVAEIDMESGAGFAGPGNHSGEANGLAADLAEWTGDLRRVQGYANGGDWASCWPTPPAWMKRRLAWYSTSAWPVPDGYYAVQYYGALPYASPPGFPRGCAPFGSYVDLNVTPRTITQILADYGIREDDPVTTPSTWGGIDQSAFKGLVSDAVTAVLNAQTAPGQASFKSTQSAILGTVQALVNAGNQQTGQILNSVADAKGAVLGYLTAHPSSVDLTQQDKDDIVAGVQEAFAVHGVNVDPEPILNALNQRLAA